MVNAQLGLVRIAPDWYSSSASASAPVQSPAPSANELEDAFAQQLELPDSLSAPLRQALRSVLDRQGTMIRPRLAFQVATAYGSSRSHATDFAIALEYFHTASLIFDDLPCMDNASIRRGGPCVHSTHGESTAILAALALINRAYALMWRASSSIPQHRQHFALHHLERQLGVRGLLQGQSLDLHYRALPHTLEFAERIAHGKTVPLISLALAFPAILEGAPARQVQLLERISLCWGLAYQIADDLKDVLRSAGETGKTTAHDASLDRPNVAVLLGVPAAVERLSRWICAGDRSLDELCRINSALDFLHEFRVVLKNELNLFLESAGAVPIDRKR